MNFDLQTVCNFIILISATIVAATNIYKFFANSGKGIKSKVDQAKEDQEREFNEKVDTRIQVIVPPMLEAQARALTASFGGLLDKHLPKRLEAHDEEKRDQYVCDIKEEVVSDLQEKIDTVDTHEEQMNVFTEVLKELLRERIMEIYRRNKKDQMLDAHERHELKQAYRSYKSINGNSYIDDYYAIMEEWETVPDNRQ